jgi:hypothetical protein
LETRRLVSDVGNVDDLLDDVRQLATVSCERPLDLVVSVAALLIRIAEVTNWCERARRRSFLLSSDPGEIDGLSGAIDG